MASHWSEIRNNHFDAEPAYNEGDALAVISIDAWRTMDDNEEGEVIAKVALSRQGDVIVSYHNNLARVDEAAQEAIRDAFYQLKEHYNQLQTAPLQSFYYTFGTDDSYPFKRGWVEVQARDMHEANQLFRANYPDKFPGVLNCAFVYAASRFEQLREDYANNPDWGVCHRVITPDGMVHSKAATLDDQIRNAEGKKGASAHSFTEKEAER